MFENYPIIKYNFVDENGLITNPEVVDIFRNVSIKQETLNDSSNFKYHAVNDGDTPEMVATEAYNNPNLWWAVLLINGMIDKEQEWPKNTQEINRIFDEFLNGNSYFIMENPDIQRNDIMVKRDLSMLGSVDIDTFGIIDNWDNHLHKIDIKTDKSKGTFIENDEFYLFRRKKVDTPAETWTPISGMGLTACAIQNMGSTFGCIQIVGPTDGGSDGSNAYGMLCATQGSTFGIIRKKSTLRSTVKQFEFEGSPIDPYSVPNSLGGASGSYYMGSGQNICGLTSTVLYKYIDDTLSNYPLIKVIGEGGDLIRKNDDRRVIKLLAPSILHKVVSEFHSLMRSSVTPGTSKYIEFNK